MMETPLLFDRAALGAHRARASHDALFLHRAACDEVHLVIAGRVLVL